MPEMRPDHISSSDEATLAFYAKSAPVYAASGVGGTNRNLHGFLALLPAGARILELGCGGGRDAAAMLAAGFDVDATDGTPEIARQAAERLGRPVRVLRFEQLDVREAYDAVWASASLLHVPRPALPDVLARIHAALKPGGLHFASYKGGGADGRDGFDRYFNYLSKAQLIDAYQQSAPWEIVSVSEYVGGGYDGRTGPWVAIVTRRAVPPAAVLR